MKKSSIIANLVVSCIFLAVSLVLLIAMPCFGIFCFAIALTFTIIYSVKLSDYNKQQNNYYQMQGNYNQLQNNYNPDFNPYPPQKKSNTAMIVTLVLIGSSAVTCCLIGNITSRSYIKKAKENSLQTDQRIAEEEKEAEFAKKLEAYQNLKIGNSVTVNGLKITVNSIVETQYNSKATYTVNITYKNNSDEKLTIYPHNWDAIMDDNSEAYYEEKFNVQYLQKDEEFTTNLIFYKERRGETANKIKCDLSDYERGLYATWLIPEDISIVTAESTTSTTPETTTIVTTEIPTEPPTENQPIDVYINAEPIMLDNGRVKFKVETNLPDETELTLYLCQNDFVVSNDAKFTVKNGVGESSELFKAPSNDKAGLISGDYKLVIGMYSSQQSDNVKEIIGEKGEYLKGNIVEKAEYGDNYNVHKTEQITLTFAGTEETAEYINRNLLEDMFSQIEHRINYIEISNTYSIQIWYEGLGDRLDSGKTTASDHAYDVTSLCQSALELCQANDPESSVYLEVIDDRDVDSASTTLIIYSFDGCPAIAVY